MNDIFLGYPPPKIRQFIEENYGPQINTTPLTFTATGDSSVLLKKVASPADISLEYSIDNGEYTTYTIGNTINLSDGQSVSMRAVDTNDIIGSAPTSPLGAYNYYNFVMSGKIAASGNIQSLLDKTCQRMDVPEFCYSYMFQDCTSLTQAPELPATTLAEACYYYMFKDCTSLTQAPELPATTLTGWCYNTMFQNCSNLSNINVNFSAWDPSDATACWVNGVASSGTFTCPTALPETYGIGNIPSGWTVVRK